MKYLIPLSLAGLLITTSVEASSTHDIEGIVTSVTPKLTRTVRSIPKQECNTVNLPIYKQNKNEEDSGAALLGGILGGILGSTVGNGSGKLVATGAGAITGAMIGNSLEDKNSTNAGEIVGYRQQEQCKTVYHQIPEEKITHYDYTYEVLGMTGSSVSVSPKSVGDKLRVRVFLSTN